MIKVIGFVTGCVLLSAAIGYGLGLILPPDLAVLLSMIVGFGLGFGGVIYAMDRWL